MIKHGFRSNDLQIASNIVTPTSGRQPCRSSTEGGQSTSGNGPHYIVKSSKQPVESGQRSSSDRLKSKDPRVYLSKIGNVGTLTKQNLFLPEVDSQVWLYASDSNECVPEQGFNKDISIPRERKELGILRPCQNTPSTRFHVVSRDYNTSEDRPGLKGNDGALNVVYKHDFKFHDTPQSTTYSVVQGTASCCKFFRNTLRERFQVNNFPRLKHIVPSRGESSRNCVNFYDFDITDPAPIVKPEIPILSLPDQGSCDSSLAREGTAVFNANIYSTNRGKSAPYPPLTDRSQKLDNAYLSPYSATQVNGPRYAKQVRNSYPGSGRYTTNPTSVYSKTLPVKDIVGNLQFPRSRRLLTASRSDPRGSELTSRVNQKELNGQNLNSALALSDSATNTNKKEAIVDKSPRDAHGCKFSLQETDRHPTVIRRVKSADSTRMSAADARRCSRRGSDTPLALREENITADFSHTEVQVVPGKEDGLVAQETPSVRFGDMEGKKSQTVSLKNPEQPFSTAKIKPYTVVDLSTMNVLTEKEVEDCLNMAEERERENGEDSGSEETFEIPPELPEKRRKVSRQNPTPAVPTKKYRPTLHLFESTLARERNEGCEDELGSVEDAVGSAEPESMTNSIVGNITTKKSRAELPPFESTLAMELNGVSSKDPVMCFEEGIGNGELQSIGKDSQCIRKSETVNNHDYLAVDDTTSRNADTAGIREGRVAAFREDTLSPHGHVALPAESEKRTRQPAQDVPKQREEDKREEIAVRTTGSSDSGAIALEESPCRQSRNRIESTDMVTEPVEEVTRPSHTVAEVKQENVTKDPCHVIGDSQNVTREPNAELPLDADTTPLDMMQVKSRGTFSGYKEPGCSSQSPGKEGKMVQSVTFTFGSVDHERKTQFSLEDCENLTDSKGRKALPFWERQDNVSPALTLPWSPLLTSADHDVTESRRPFPYWSDDVPLAHHYQDIDEIRRCVKQHSVPPVRCRAASENGNYGASKERKKHFRPYATMSRGDGAGSRFPVAEQGCSKRMNGTGAAANFNEDGTYLRPTPHRQSSGPQLTRRDQAAIQKQDKSEDSLRSYHIDQYNNEPRSYQVNQSNDGSRHYRVENSKGSMSVFGRFFGRWSLRKSKEQAKAIFERKSKTPEPQRRMQTTPMHYSHDPLVPEKRCGQKFLITVPVNSRGTRDSIRQRSSTVGGKATQESPKRQFLTPLFGRRSKSKGDKRSLESHSRETLSVSEGRGSGKGLGHSLRLRTQSDSTCDVAHDETSSFPFEIVDTKEAKCRTFQVFHRPRLSDSSSKKSDRASHSSGSSEFSTPSESSLFIETRRTLDAEAMKFARNLEATSPLFPGDVSKTTLLQNGTDEDAEPIQLEGDHALYANFPLSKGDVIPPTKPRRQPFPLVTPEPYSSRKQYRRQRLSYILCHEDIKPSTGSDDEVENFTTQVHLQTSNSCVARQVLVDIHSVAEETEQMEASPPKVGGSEKGPLLDNVTSSGKNFEKSVTNNKGINCRSKSSEVSGTCTCSHKKETKEVRKKLLSPTPDKKSVRLSTDGLNRLVGVHTQSIREVGNTLTVSCNCQELENTSWSHFEVEAPSLRLGLTEYTVLPVRRKGSSSAVHYFAWLRQNLDRAGLNDRKLDLGNIWELTLHDNIIHFCRELKGESERIVEEFADGEIPRNIRVDNVFLSRTEPRMSLSKYILQNVELHDKDPYVYESIVCFVILQVLKAVHHMWTKGFVVECIESDFIFVLHQDGADPQSPPHVALCCLPGFICQREGDSKEKLRKVVFSIGCLLFELLHLSQQMALRDKIRNSEDVSSIVNQCALSRKMLLLAELLLLRGDGKINISNIIRAVEITTFLPAEFEFDSDDELHVPLERWYNRRCIDVVTGILQRMSLGQLLGKGEAKSPAVPNLPINTLLECRFLSAFDIADLAKVWRKIMKYSTRKLSVSAKNEEEVLRGT